MIAQHLFHTGKFRVGELFVEEAGVLGGEALKEPFTALHEILVQVRGSPVSSPAVIRGPVLCVLACRAIYPGVLAHGL